MLLSYRVTIITEKAGCIVTTLAVFAIGLQNFVIRCVTLVIDKVTQVTEIVSKLTITG